MSDLFGEPFAKMLKLRAEIKRLQAAYDELDDRSVKVALSDIAKIKKRDAEIERLQAKVAQIEAIPEERRIYVGTPGADAKRVEKQDAEMEKLQVQLAGCLTAAEGHAYCDIYSYGWSPAGQAVADLRAELEGKNHTRLDQLEVDYARQAVELKQLIAKVEDQSDRFRAMLDQRTALEAEVKQLKAKLAAVLRDPMFKQGINK